LRFFAFASLLFTCCSERYRSAFVAMPNGTTCKGTCTTSSALRQPTDSPRGVGYNASPGSGTSVARNPHHRRGASSMHVLGKVQFAWPP
jgi:hypothetical protein